MTHHLDSTSHIHDDSASMAFVLAVLPDHDNAALVCSSLKSLDPLPASPNIPLHVDDSLTDALPPLENNIFVPVSLQFVDQTTTEHRCITSTSPDPVITRARHRYIEKSRRTMHISTLEPLERPPKPKASTCPPDATTTEQTTASLTPLDCLNVLLSPSPAVDNMFPPGPPLTLGSPVS